MATALKAVRDQDVLDDDAVFDIRVEILTRPSRILALAKLCAWRYSNSPGPNKAALKARLR